MRLPIVPTAATFARLFLGQLALVGGRPAYLALLAEALAGQRALSAASERDARPTAPGSEGAQRRAAKRARYCEVMSRCSGAGRRRTSPPSSSARTGPHRRAPGLAAVP